MVRLSFESVAFSTVIGTLKATGAFSIWNGSRRMARAFGGSRKARLYCEPSSERWTPRYHMPMGISLPAIFIGMLRAKTVQKLLPNRQFFPFVKESNLAASSYPFFRGGPP